MLADAFRYHDIAASELEGDDGMLHLDRALALYDEVGDELSKSKVLSLGGVRAYYRGDWTIAADLYGRAKDAADAGGDVVGAAIESANAAEILIDQGRIDEARPLIESALRVFAASDNPYLVAFVDRLRRPRRAPRGRCGCRGRGVRGRGRPLRGPRRGRLRARCARARRSRPTSARGAGRAGTRHGRRALDPRRRRRAPRAAGSSASPRALAAADGDAGTRRRAGAGGGRGGRRDPLRARPLARGARRRRRTRPSRGPPAESILADLGVTDIPRLLSVSQTSVPSEVSEPLKRDHPMSIATPLPSPSVRRSAMSRRRGVALAAITALLVSGLVALPASAATAAIPLPTDAVAFLASQTDSGASTEPSLTPDGQHVAFTSTASDLVPGDTNGFADVFLSAAGGGDDRPLLGGGDAGERARCRDAAGARRTGRARIPS